MRHEVVGVSEQIIVDDAAVDPELGVELAPVFLQTIRDRRIEDGVGASVVAEVRRRQELIARKVVASAREGEQRERHEGRGDGACGRARGPLVEVRQSRLFDYGLESMASPQRINTAATRAALTSVTLFDMRALGVLVGVVVAGIGRLP